MKRFLTCVCAGLWVFGVLAVSACAAARGPSRVILASWNIENLFDADDDPDNPGDDEYTPSGWTRWTEARYRQKLTNVATVIVEMAPDILGIAEVENRRVLEDLAEVMRSVHRFDLPHIIHRDSGDQRGIDNAILTRFKPKKVTWLTPLSEQRPMIVADFAPWGQPVTFVMNHWKSRYGARAAAYTARAIEARALRQALDRRLHRDPAAAIVVAGDFNDDIDDAIPNACAGFVLDEHAVLADGLLLYNLSASLPPSKRGSYFYKKDNRWNSFDFMCVSRGLLRKGKPMSAWVVKRDSYEIFVRKKMRMQNGAPLPFRRLYTKQGVLNYTGYSDHFPVRLTLELRP